MPDIVTEECEFWMVWTKSGNKPRFVHQTEESALTEAKRLAALHPGKKFIVLRAFTKISAQAATGDVIVGADLAQDAAA